MSGRAETETIIPGQFAISVGHPDLPAPYGWQWVRLQDVARLETGHTPSREKPEYWDGEIGWIGIRDARENHGGYIHTTQQTITPLGIENSAARILPANTVCLSRTASVGYVVVMQTPMATSQDFVNWVCSESIDPKFLLHLLIAENESLFKFGKGTTHTTIYFPEVKAFHVCLPPLGEQKRIVERLEALQARSRAAREALAEVPTLLEQYRQSVLAAAFRGDLTASWREKNPNAEPASVLLDRIRTVRRKQWEAKYPKKKYVEPEPVDDTDLPELPEGWCWTTLQELAWGSGYGTSAKCDYTGAGHPVLRIPNVAAGAVNYDDLKFALEVLDLPKDEWLAAGDFLIVRTNGSHDLIGRGAIVQITPSVSTYFASYLIRYRLVGGVELGHWLSTIWQSSIMRRELESRAATSAGQYNVSLGKLDTVAVPIPPIHEIQELNRLMADLERFASSIAVNINSVASELNQLDQSLLAKAFRGELVPQDPADEPASVLLERIRNGGTTVIRQNHRLDHRDIVRNLVLLLRTYTKPLDRATVELGLVLMNNDSARTAILDKTVKAGRGKATRRVYLEGLDYIFGRMKVIKYLNVSDDIPQMLSLGTKAPDTDDATIQDLQRVRETIQVIKAVEKDRLAAIVEKVCDVHYELVPGT